MFQIIEQVLRKNAFVKSQQMVLKTLKFKLIGKIMSIKKQKYVSSSFIF